MSVKNEFEGGPNTDFERDSDIHTLSVVRDAASTVQGVNFVLTGSYAIEALTRIPLRHGDMDANIFTLDLSHDLSRVAAAVSSMEGVQTRVYKQTDDRLEYDVLSSAQTGFRRLELQFVETVCMGTGNSTDFILRSKDGRSINVPISMVFLTDSRGKNFFFQVKSLAYAIATWAIRISGHVLDPKRNVRASDLEQFRLLMEAPHDLDEVISAMSHHPQMPTNFSEIDLLKKAAKRIDTTFKTGPH